MTYFATDIAYHIHKFKNYDLLIDIWGADHHDYAIRLQTALKALGYDVENRLQIHLVQFANLLRSGESISMSTRSGTFYPIQDLVRDIGEDATKFFYLTKKKDQHLEFDIDKAIQRDKNNPIYYIQYAHARITKILIDFDEKKSMKEDFNQLNTKNEINLLKLINKYHETFNKAIDEVRPDLITNYLYQLSKSFHSYYADTKILTSIVKMEKIKLVKCIDKIIHKRIEYVRYRANGFYVMKQNTIALVYDFDGTLTPKTMQEYTIIPRLKLNSKKFWKSIIDEANNSDGEVMMIYMRRLITEAKKLNFDITKNQFNEMASNIKYFKGVPKLV